MNDNPESESSKTCPDNKISFWYGNFNISYNSWGVSVGVWDGLNYGPSIIMWPHIYLYYDIRNQKLAKIGLKTDCEFEPICEGW